MRQSKPILLALAFGIALPATAVAQRKSPLADAPAVRNRVELRQKRAELGAGIGTTLNQDFWHAVLFNVRAGFHLNDWIGIGAMVGLNITPDMTTGFHDRLVEVLPSSTGPGRAPTRADAEKTMNKIGEVVALQLEATPFAGKYSMFGKLFFNYDFYAFVGPGFVHVKTPNAGGEVPSCDVGMGPSCKYEGFQPGGNFGIGMHTFVNQFVAINAEMRNLLIRNNPAGRDVNGDRVANKDDVTWDANYILTLGLTLFLPTSAAISP